MGHDRGQKLLCGNVRTLQPAAAAGGQRPLSISLLLLRLRRCPGPQRGQLLSAEGGLPALQNDAALARQPIRGRHCRFSSHLQAWGKCDWLKSKNYCAATCGRCSSSSSPSSSSQSQCSDTKTPDGYSCQQQKVRQVQARDYAPCLTPVARFCTPPPKWLASNATPAVQDWGKCGWDFMVKNSYCSKTCGRC